MIHRNLKIGLALLAVCVFTRPAFAAQSGGAKELGDVLLQFTPAIHYIWTDKQAYNPNENQTLFWTAGANSDPYPYTLFVYRENLVTGQRMYLDTTGPSLVGEVTDAFGGTAATGFNVQTIPSVNKLPLISTGAPSAAGNYHYVAEIRDFTRTRVVRAAYAKFVVYGSEVVFDPPAAGEGVFITENTTWVSTTLYRMRTKVFVESGATLTIEPGTHILSNSDDAILIVKGRRQNQRCRDPPPSHRDGL